jgi:hypothetical protein
MRWARHVAHTGEWRGVEGFWWGNLRERDHVEDPGIDGRIIFKWIFRKWVVGYGLYQAGSGSGRWQAVVNAVMYLRVP